MDHNSVSFDSVTPGIDRLSHSCLVDETLTLGVSKFTSFLRAQEKDNLMQNEHEGVNREI